VLVAYDMRLFLLVLMFKLYCTASPLAVPAQPNPTSRTIQTTITALVTSSNKFNAKRVRIFATYDTDGIHRSVLLEPNCGVFEGTSKTPPSGQPQCESGVVPRETDKLESDSNYERLLQVLNQGERSTRDKHITAEFTGIFRCKPSCTSPKFFVLEMERVEKVEVVWKNLKPHLPEK